MAHHDEKYENSNVAKPAIPAARGAVADQKAEAGRVEGEEIQPAVNFHPTYHVTDSMLSKVDSMRNTLAHGGVVDPTDLGILEEDTYRFEHVAIGPWAMNDGGVPTIKIQPKGLKRTYVLEIKEAANNGDYFLDHLEKIMLPFLGDVSDADSDFTVYLGSLKEPILKVSTICISYTNNNTQNRIN